MTRILITGSEGFIGTHLADTLRQSAADVWTLDRSGEGDQHFRTELKNFDRFDEFDVIYHLIAMHGPQVCAQNQDATWRCNVEEMRRLVSTCRAGQHVIFTSTSHVYGPESDGHWEESERPRPTNYYGHTKKIGEELLAYWARKHRFSYTIFRPFHVFGPGQEQGSIIPDVIQKAKTKRTIEIPDPETRLSLTYIDDVIEVLTNRLIPQGVYNLCGPCLSIEEIYRAITSKFQSSCYRGEDQGEENHCGDNSKLAPYKADWTSFERGLSETISHTK